MQGKGYLTADGRVRHLPLGTIGRIDYWEKRYNLRRVFVARGWIVTLNDGRRFGAATRREAIASALARLTTTVSAVHSHDECDTCGPRASPTCFVECVCACHDTTCAHCAHGIWWDVEDRVWRHEGHEGETCGEQSPDTIATPRRLTVAE